MKTILAFFAFWVVFLFLCSRDVWAWGAGIHIAQGEFILNNLNVVLPVIRELIQSYPLDFLYGLISAIFLSVRVHGEEMIIAIIGQLAEICS